MQPRLDGANLDAEQPGRLGIRQSRQVEQQHGRSLAVRQIVHGAANPVREIRHLCLLLRAALPVSGLGNLSTPDKHFPGPALGCAFAQSTSADVLFDATEPGRESLRALEAFKAEQRLEDRLVGGIFGGE